MLPDDVVEDVLVAKDVVLHLDRRAGSLGKRHLTDALLHVVVNRVSGHPRRERCKPMSVADPHHQPFDVDVSAEHPDVDERAAVVVHAVEAVQRTTSAPTVVGKERDHIAPDPEHDGVVDGLRNGVGEVF